MTKFSDLQHKLYFLNESVYNQVFLPRTEVQYKSLFEGKGPVSSNYWQIWIESV